MRRRALAVVPILVLIGAGAVVANGAQQPHDAGLGQAVASTGSHAEHAASAGLADPAAAPDPSDADLPVTPTATAPATTQDTTTAQDTATAAETSDLATAMRHAAAVDPAAVVGFAPDSAVAQAPTATLSDAAATGTQERVGAQDLGQARAPVDPADLITSSTSLGGCHPDYGGSGQCLPLIPPSQSEHAAQMLRAGQDPASMAHPWTCSELLTYFPEGVAVRPREGSTQRDPFGFDPDGDLIACGPD